MIHFSQQTPHHISSTESPILKWLWWRNFVNRIFLWYVFKNFQIYFICFLLIYYFYSLHICKNIHGICFILFSFIIVISWYSYGMKWVSMNKTSIYNAALVGNKRSNLEWFTLWLSSWHRLCHGYGGHLHHSSMYSIGTHSSWVLLQKFIFCELVLLYFYYSTGYYNPLVGFSLLSLEVSRSHTRTHHSQ